MTALPRLAAQPDNPVPQSEPVSTEATVAPPDPRIAYLDSFFATHKCPYRNTTAYLSSADKYSIDYRLLPALSIIEESCGVHNPGNNLFGYGSSTGLRKFPSIEAGIDFVASQLANGRYYKGKTLKQKLHAYNSVNPQYYAKVTGLMNEIEKVTP